MKKLIIYFVLVENENGFMIPTTIKTFPNPLKGKTTNFAARILQNKLILTVFYLYSVLTTLIRHPEKYLLFAVPIFGGMENRKSTYLEREK